MTMRYTPLPAGAARELVLFMAAELIHKADDEKLERLRVDLRAPVVRFDGQHVELEAP